MKADLIKGVKVCSSKKCKFAGQEQPISNFGKNKSATDGLHNLCKNCIKEYDKKHYEANREMAIKRSKEYRISNPNYQKEYYKKNPNYLNNYRREKRKLDPLFKLSEILRTRLNIALKTKSWKKNTHFAEYIGCSLQELKIYLEKQFTEGMTWQNHGRWHPKIKRWQIDHKIPLDSAKTEEELYKLCHYTNLQPLWADDNLSKSYKILTGKS